MPWRRLTDPSALVASLLLHAGLLGAGAWVVTKSLRGDEDPGDPPRTIEISLHEDEPSSLRLPRVTTGAGSDVGMDPNAPRPRRRHEPNGGVEVARPDLRQAGRGGSNEAQEFALNLADSIDGITRDRDPMNRLDRSQLQRLETARHRRTRDDRRATPNPMELTFVSSGDGLLHERRPPSRYVAEHGLKVGARPSQAGGQLGDSAAPGDGWAGPLGASHRGGERIAAVGNHAGVRGGGLRRSASVVLARPSVRQARAAVPASVRGRPNDDIDSFQEVATTVQSLVHASTAGGRLGPGPGGQRGLGSPASGGGVGEGSRSAAVGRGGSGDIGYDPRFSGYHRGLIARVNRFWGNAFPTWAIAEGRGGVAIVEMALARDGSVASVRVVRPSGIPEFDRNLISAIRRAAPFEPLPAALRPRHWVSIQFDATNPAVGRDGP